MSHPNRFSPPLPARLVGAVLASLLVSCSGPGPEERSGAPAATPATGPAPANESSTPAAPTPASAPEESPAPAEPSRDAVPADVTPSSGEQLARQALPSLEAMSQATPSAKMSVPVDLRYSLTHDGDPAGGTVLHLAAVPRVPLSNLKMSIGPTPGLEITTQAVTVQKAEASHAYRQQITVPRRPQGPAQIRVLVTADLGEGIGFGIFTVPLDPTGRPDKQESVKQR